MMMGMQWPSLRSLAHRSRPSPSGADIEDDSVEARILGCLTTFRGLDRDGFGCDEFPVYRELIN